MEIMGKMGKLELSLMAWVLLNIAVLVPGLLMMMLVKIICKVKGKNHREELLRDCCCFGIINFFTSILCALFLGIIIFFILDIIIGWKGYGDRMNLWNISFFICYIGFTIYTVHMFVEDK